MAFWKGETLLARLPSLIPQFDPDQIDCAAYTLTLGGEVFVTAELPDVSGIHEGVKSKLSPGQQIRISPGQFAFLLTQENVKVPNDAIAFISMKATYKFKGLINVSGFHVDPGWKGHLVFGVYNAGPSPVCLAQGTPLFLIWYADLDGTSDKVKKIKGEGQTSINPDLVTHMSGEVFSPILLSRKILDLNAKLTAAEHKLSLFWHLTSIVGAVLLVAAGGMATVLWDMHKNQSSLEKQISLHTVSSSHAKSIDSSESSPGKAIPGKKSLPKNF